MNNYSINESWLCPCGAKVWISDTDLHTTLMEILNRLILQPDMRREAGSLRGRRGDGYPPREGVEDALPNAVQQEYVPLLRALYTRADRKQKVMERLIMKKVDLNAAAEEFEMISDETHLFYNTETGEFDFFSDFMESEDADTEKFEKDCWVAAPSQRDIGEYDMMSDFTDTVTDPRKNELLSVALEGKGAFRRFKDTLQRVGLTER